MVHAWGHSCDFIQMETGLAGFISKASALTYLWPGLGRLKQLEQPMLLSCVSLSLCEFSMWSLYQVSFKVMSFFLMTQALRHVSQENPAKELHSPFLPYPGSQAASFTAFCCGIASNTSPSSRGEGDDLLDWESVKEFMNIF